MGKSEIWSLKSHSKYYKTFVIFSISQKLIVDEILNILPLVTFMANKFFFAINLMVTKVVNA